METEDGFQPVFFDPRPLKNLMLVDESSSLAPITDMKVGGRDGDWEGWAGLGVVGTSAAWHPSLDMVAGRGGDCGGRQQQLLT